MCQLHKIEISAEFELQNLIVTKNTNKYFRMISTCEEPVQNDR